MEQRIVTRRLPFRAKTASGEQIDIDFPLHAETASPTQVANMLSAVLASLDAEVRINASVSNGDVLQALAMALAIRAAMIEAPKRLTDRLAADLVVAALGAMEDAKRDYVHRGRA
jgi:hypothetical protein